MKTITMKMVGIGLASVFAAMTAAQAADVSWKNDADGNWSVAGNWIGSSGAPTGTLGVATFNTAITANRTVTLDASPWTIKNFVFTNNSPGNAYGWTITGGTFNQVVTFTVNGSASSATVASALSGVDVTKAGSGTLILTGNSGVGVASMTGGGTLVLNGGTMTNVAVSQAAGYQSFGNTIVVSNSAVWNLGGQQVNFSDGGGSGTSGSNQLIISGAVVTNVGTAFRLGYHNCTGSSVVITNGGKLYSLGFGYVGQSASFANSLVVSGNGSLWDNGGQNISISDAVGSTNNWMTIADHGMVTNVNNLYVGAASAASCQGSLTVSGGGKLSITNELQLGYSASSGLLDITDGGSVYVASTLKVGNLSSTNCSLTVRNGGLLDASAIIMGKLASAGTGDVLTVSSGGILQFTTNAPSITINNAAGGNGVVITNGTLSFRGITSGALPNLTNNLAKSGGFSTNNITWLGKNKFRLDSSSATNSVAGGYVFEDNGKAYNYVGLELVNGATALRGSGVTIGASGGSALFSNTTATVGCTFTNNGTLTVANSAVTFSSDLTLGSGCAVNVVSTNQMPMTVSGTLKADGGTVSLPASLGKTDGFALFTSPNVIAGTVKNMTLSSPMHQLVLTEGGKTLVVLPKRGTLISIF